MKNSTTLISKRYSFIQAIVASALAFTLAFSTLATPPQAFATTNPTTPQSGTTRIHVLSFTYTDAIILESNGHFGIVDSGEDDDYPDGKDKRYPLRSGITIGGGVDRTVIAYLKKLGVNSNNLEFYLGTHPHSDHIGSAAEIIREFKPARVYLSEYQDSFISDPARLWDNQYVYDNAIAAAKESGAVLIQNLDPNAPLIPASEPQTYSEDILDPTGEEPAVEVLDAEGVIERFSVDPTDQTSPNNAEVLPDQGIAVMQSNDPNLVTESAPNPATTGNPNFTLGDMIIEIVNYRDDYKFNPVPDANYFSWGVKVTANSSTAFLSGDINNYDGDEESLAPLLGKINLLKVAHHGFDGSNTANYLTAISPDYAIQTGSSSILPEYARRAFDTLGTRYFTAEEVASNGYTATVSTFTPNGISLNVMEGGTTLRQYSSSPHVLSVQGGLPAGRQNGWHAVNGAWYWFNNNTYATENAWHSERGMWYWLKETGKMATGWAKATDGKWYYLNSSGAMQSNGWLKLGSTWYWLTGSGAMQTGWLKTGGKWYWLNDSGAMATGWAKAKDDKWYYLEGSGAMRSGGWSNIGGAWYWLTGSGAMQTGWLKTGGKWYWLNDSGAMATGWAKAKDDKWYYLNGSGAMQSGGWLKLGSSWYYLNGSGAMQTGWLDLGSKRYYLNESGAMATGAVTIDGETYQFNGSGALINR